MKCTNCGKELIDGSKFCLECGTKVPEANQTLTCKSCGKELVAGAKFCLECGAKAGGSNDNMILVCGKCGTIPKEGKKFCHNCGANVSETGVMKPKDSTKTPEQSVNAPKMIAMTSEVNPWSYEVPDFFLEMKDMDMQFIDEEDFTQLLSSKMPYAYTIMRNIHGSKQPDGSTTDSISTFIKSSLGQSDVISQKETTINGLSVKYYQVKDTAYYHYAFIEKDGFYYVIMICVPLGLQEDVKGIIEAMDAFIYSFKLKV